MGAAMASIAAGYIANFMYIPGDMIKLVTFGQPRTGDADYAAFIDRTVSVVKKYMYLHVNSSYQPK